MFRRGMNPGFKNRGLMVGLLLLFICTLSGCKGFMAKDPDGQLVLQPADQLNNWNIPERLQQTGEGNVVRAVKSVGLSAESGLELAAGGQGEMEYFADGDAAAVLAAVLRVQFLSTQGTGRIKISARDADGRQLAAVGWSFTGPVPPATATEQWTMRPFGANYSGCWLEERHDVEELFRGRLSAAEAARVARYRISVVAGQGQHVLITQLQLLPDRSRSVRVTALRGVFTVSQGDEVPVTLEVENISGSVLQNLPVELSEPAGFGLAAGEKRRMLARLEPGQKESLTWQVKALRPDAVNFGRPWEMGVTVDGIAVAPAPLRFAVTDPKPGRIFYVMTEDLEAIDSAGYAVLWGNGNGWLEPQELKTQMVTKSERLNTIAEKYGAKWTHYTTWPLIKAAEWADRQSPARRWNETVQAMRDSVRAGAAKGHEYALHLHTDYDPRLAGNLLSYYSPLDGLWANHLRHGWAHSLSREGTPDDLTSRTGILYDYQAVMDSLSADSPQGQLLNARVGSFDFGDGAKEEALSTRAYRKAGIWGSSDADGNAGGITAADYGREIYFARQDDINAPAREFSELGLVEIRPTPRECIAYDTQSAAVMNRKVDEGVAAFSADGRTKPGVHMVMGFTHAMFIMGSGDWQSLEGGQFQEIDKHLAYLKDRYVTTGALHFATASQVVREYLDYYTPVLVAVYDAKIQDQFGYTEYGISLLGRDIPLSPQQPQQVRIKYPLYLRHSAFRLVICKNGQPVVSTWGLPAPDNEIGFVADDRQAKYTLKVYHNPAVAQLAVWVRDLRQRWLEN